MEYFRNLQTLEVYGYDPETQQELIDEALANGWENITGSWPPPPAPPTAEQNKATATSLLQSTDWVNQPDVRNSANNPHLVNASDFDAYRLAVRQYAVYPVAGDIDWPTLPTEEWSV